MDGKDASLQAQHLGDAVRRIIQRDDTLYGKFRGILDSFRAIIPDEQQRYLAAIQALSTTAKLNRDEITAAINRQVDELKLIEQGLTPFLVSWRDTLKAMEARQQAIKAELAQLRDRITQLENEDRSLVVMKLAREQNLALAEKKISGIFASIGAELQGVSRKMAELPGDVPAPPAAVQPVPPTAPPVVQTAPAKSAAPAEPVGGVQEKSGITLPPAPVDSKFQKKCPMCGGQFNLLELQNLWQCFTCGHEESAAGTV